MRISDWSSDVCSSDLVAIALGTLAGGWKIIESMGGRITKLSHHQGFAASTGGSIMVFTASLLGIPVSTTHTITGSIIGAGVRSEEHTSELQSLMRISYAVFCLKKKNTTTIHAY